MTSEEKLQNPFVPDPEPVRVSSVWLVVLGWPWVMVPIEMTTAKIMAAKARPFTVCLPLVSMSAIS